MSIDYSKLQMSSKASSNKTFKEGSGSFTTAALVGAGEVTSTATIVHGLNNDIIIPQVSTTTDIAGTSNWVTIPFESNDGRVYFYASVDNTNLYITRINYDISGTGWPSTTTSYNYRLLIP